MKIMSDYFESFGRTEMLLGKRTMEKLRSSRVAVFGVGGVGGYVAEALVRSGLGAIDIIDADTVALSNLNRQIIATHETVGMKKTEAAKLRFLSINPEVKVTCIDMFYLPDNADSLDLSVFDYIVDAVDTVSAKREIAVRSAALGIPLISSMGFGNKLDPTAVEVADLYSTSVCPLARTMRRLLRQDGIEHLKVVYSREVPVHPDDSESDDRRTVASVAFVPSAAGLVIASEVIKSLAGLGTDAH